VRVSKHWNPRKPSVALKPSRIRRDPVRLVSDVPSARRTVRRTDDQETWFGIAGVLSLAAVIVTTIVGISVATFSKYDPAEAAKAARFGQCYNAEGPNCVLDGDTIYFGREKVVIAGITAPEIQGAHCDAERSRGVDAAVLLVDLLNSGNVTVSRTFNDEYGREVRKVLVKGKDVRDAMLVAGAVQKYKGMRRKWCP
jgi:micrococcal nuclease